MIEKNQFYSNDHPARAIDNRYTFKYSEGITLVK